MNQLAFSLEPHEIAEGEAAAQAVMAFLLRLRARGISDVAVLRALETIPRERFVPHRYADLALRDIALPIGCGQTMPEAWLVARMMEALDLAPSHRVLEVGTGSGYATAILSRLAGEVVTCEIFEALALESAARLSALGLTNVKVLQADGFERLGDLGLFDRILIHGLVEGRPVGLFECLSEGGVILVGRGEAGRATLARIAHQGSEGFVETPVCPGRFGTLIGAAALAR